MNQQRARRFQSAKEKEKIQKVEEEYRKELGDEKELPLIQKPFDSNVISPGTEFMKRVKQALEYYINHRIQYYSGWKNLKVIFSGSDVPGEGEHK